MRIHVFTDPADLDLAATNLLVLGPRKRTDLVPDPSGAPVRVELEVMIVPNTGTALLLSAHPSAVIELGLEPALPLMFVNHDDEPAALSYWFRPPRVAMTLEVGTPLVEALLIAAPLERFYHDPAMADLLASGFIGRVEHDSDSPL